MTKKRMKHDYVDNKKMYAAMVEWKNKIKEAEAEGLPKPKVPEYIGQCIYLIATNLAKAPNFANYSFKEEMIGDGIENVLLYIENFDPEKSSNPFSYFTQTMWYAFIRRIQKEKKQIYVKQKLLIHDTTFNNLVAGSSDEQFSGATMTIDPDKFSALEDIFEKKKNKKEEDE